MSLSRKEEMLLSIERLSSASDMVVLGHVCNNPDHHSFAVEHRRIDLFERFSEGFLFLNLTENLGSGPLETQLEELQNMDENRFLVYLLNLREEQVSLLSDPEFLEANHKVKFLVSNAAIIRNDLVRLLSSLHVLHQKSSTRIGVELSLEEGPVRSVLKATGLSERIDCKSVHFKVSAYLDPHVIMLHFPSTIVIIVGPRRLKEKALPAIALHELSHVLFERFQIPSRIIQSIKRYCIRDGAQIDSLYDDVSLAEELLVEIICRYYCKKIAIDSRLVSPLKYDWQEILLRELPDNESDIESLSYKMLDLLSSPSRWT